MLNKFRVLLSIAGVLLTMIILMTQNFKLTPYMLGVLGITLLLNGIIDLQRAKKGVWGYLSIIVALYVFFVMIQGYFLK